MWRKLRLVQEVPTEANLGGGEELKFSRQATNSIPLFLSAQSFSLRNKNIVWKNTAQEEEEVFKDRY